EFVTTMNQLLERTNDTTGRMGDHIGQFYGVTTKTLHDLTALASGFDGQGRSLAQAVELVETSNRRTDEVLGARRAALDEVAAGLDSRTADLDARLQRFSGLLTETLDGRTADLGGRLQQFSGLLHASPLP